ncbi:hypothetical protein SEUCBS140593_010698 [Sporothrix eucalyptigena]|uniref:Gfo/Idh/MocA-like oxidoreductase N-terminal domain-containing protein n=1 Tax=Sporothrix eucalyptigena TaxID=1812306 RepID=A0ABP0D265_9PEZI
MVNSTSPSRVVRVGIIGCGEIAQVVHIPTLNLLAHKFRVTYLCDVAAGALETCADRVVLGPDGKRPATTTSAEELCASADVDAVLIANADAYHVEHGLLALAQNKHVLIEKPAALCFRDIDRLIAAEKQALNGTRVFVGTMRRYATAFEDAVKEVGGFDRVHYARVRDIIGPNALGVSQSGTFPRPFQAGDVTAADSNDRAGRELDIQTQALSNEFGVPLNDASKRMLRVLGALGTHSLSAMRELLGMPQSVAGAALTLPGIFAVLFRYENFPVTYESGLSGVPTFDANIEVYSTNKIVRVNFDMPYVKGLPVTLTIRERVEEEGAEPYYQERTVRKTYKDPYTLEMQEFYEVVVNGKMAKTSIADSRNDLELFKMILQAGYKA